MLRLFSRRPVDYFSAKEKQKVVAAIQKAEHQTSGEVRIFIESRCRFVDPLRRAHEIFGGLKMYETAARNAVLVYVAMKDRQLAIYGDEGIHQRVVHSVRSLRFPQRNSHCRLWPSDILVVVVYEQYLYWLSAPMPTILPVSFS